MERRKPGPPSKGPRVQMKHRVPPALRDAVLAEASRHGMTVNDWIGELLADELGVPYTTQEALPLTKAS